jgi:hypothetical protein
VNGVANLGIDLDLECEFGYRPECSLPLGYVQCVSRVNKSFVRSVALGPY